MKIVVIGSSNTDMVIKVSRLPKTGETILGGKFYTTSGGRGANQAVAAARAGGDVTFVARVGNDMFGERAIASFEEEGIKTDHIVKDNDLPSGVAEIFVDENGHSMTAVASGANMNLSVYDIINAKQAIMDADIVLMQLEVPLKTLEYAVKLASDSRKRFILNPAPAQQLPISLLKTISVITPNEKEAELLTGIRVEDEDSAEDAGRILLSKGVSKVIITLGSQGAMVLDSSGSELVTGFKINPVDTTAAGDIFNGALAVAIAESKNIFEAVKFANAAAALSMARIGAQSSAPGREEILKFMSENFL
ncbi:MAG: ribokinase [Bacteroidales bacterium]|nr:ribokinase [Bacteroidales bacterium]